MCVWGGGGGDLGTVLMTSSVFLAVRSECDHQEGRQIRE